MSHCRLRIARRECLLGAAQLRKQFVAVRAGLAGRRARLDQRAKRG